MLTRIFAIIATVFFASTVHAEQSAAPTDDVVLSITGAFANDSAGDTLLLDRNALSALGMESFETTTIWTEGTQTFQGVPLSALARHIGVTQGTFFASAINDYTVEIPVSDATEGGPIVAMLLNGQEMSVRDKGPLWIVYPYDSSVEYRSEVIYSRSIWQLDRIKVVQ